MTPEKNPMPSSERLLLASTVNKFCSIYEEGEIDVKSLLEDAQKIVDSLDPIIQISNNFFIRVTSRKRPSSFGGKVLTDMGDFQTSIETGDKQKRIEVGHNYEERIGLYKVNKTNEQHNIYSLNFNYFIEQVSTVTDVVSIGQITHILYDKDSHTIRAILKSDPVLFQVLDYKIIYFKHSTLWGKGKLDTFSFQLYK